MRRLLQWGLKTKWVEAVNEDGKFGAWSWDVDFDITVSRGRIVSLEIL